MHADVCHFLVDLNSFKLNTCIITYSTFDGTPKGTCEGEKV